MPIVSSMLYVRVLDFSGIDSENVTDLSPKVNIILEEGHMRMWQSSSVLRDAKGTTLCEVNMALCAAILCSGNNFKKISYYLIIYVCQ